MCFFKRDRSTLCVSKSLYFTVKTGTGILYLFCGAPILKFSEKKKQETYIIG